MPTKTLSSLTRVIASFLRLCAWLLRICAILLAAIVLVLTFASGTLRSALLPAANFFGSLIPQQMSGLFVVETIFGGAFRGDFALASVALLIIDWLVCKVASSIEDGRQKANRKADRDSPSWYSNPPTYPNGGRVALPYESYNSNELKPELRRKESLQRIGNLTIEDSE